ncbi:unnamed protein product [Prorocentrum cordatum]|uniref:Calmodulin n=1 Tax=Prorocentrum cordatum TaxID=2364126 RepID=A0ABN9V160_9DINO|nr:unnamed protein product [Polarella glacialis]
MGLAVSHGLPHPALEPFLRRGSGEGQEDLLASLGGQLARGSPRLAAGQLAELSGAGRSGEAGELFALFEDEQDSRVNGLQLACALALFDRGAPLRHRLLRLSAMFDWSGAGSLSPADLAMLLQAAGAALRRGLRPPPAALQPGDGGPGASVRELCARAVAGRQAAAHEVGGFGLRTDNTPRSGVAIVLCMPPAAGVARALQRHAEPPSPHVAGPERAGLASMAAGELVAAVRKAVASSPAPAAAAELIAAVRKGRIDRAIALAKPLAAARSPPEEPRVLAARECSDEAARLWRDGLEARERAVALAVSGGTFTIPGRGRVKPDHLRQGFWLREVSDWHEGAEAVSRLARASMALRGLDPGCAETVEQLQARCKASGDASAQLDAAAAARDLELLGLAAPVRLITSRSRAVLQAFVGRELAQDPSALARCPALVALLAKAGRYFDAELGDRPPPGPLGPAASPVGVYPCPPLRHWAEARRLAAERQMRFIAEIASEAAVGLLQDPSDGFALMEVAVVFFKAECPLGERKAALKVFAATQARLEERARDLRS